MNFQYFFKNAKYVRAEGEHQFPYIRKEFSCDGDIKRATLYVSVLGFCELYANGKKITDDLFVTPYMQYNMQKPEDMEPNFTKNRLDEYFNDELGFTVPVSEFDVKEFLLNGKNALGIIVAGGWYFTDLDKYSQYRHYGRFPKACFRLEIEKTDGEIIDIISDESCLCKDSFLLRAGIYHEEQDERLENTDFSMPDYNAEGWKKAEVHDALDAKYILNECPPDRIIKYITPVLIKETENEKIYDCKENTTGFPIIIGKGKEGDVITLKHSEDITEDGALDEAHYYSQFSTFVANGNKAEHHIRFTWHGFRYFSVSTTGNLSELNCEKVAFIHADMKNTSTFECDNETVNFIYDAYIRTQLENCHCGVPSDCPQIERKGYTGDGQLLAPLGMMLFNSKSFYKKWLLDISDSQDQKSGFVHHTAPIFAGCGGGLGGWSVAIITVPYAYYKAYGDTELLREFYPKMKKYMSFMEDETLNGLIEIHKRPTTDWGRLGDWNGPRKPLLPQNFVNSCLYAEALYKVIEIASALGETDDIPEIEAKIASLKAAIDANFFDSETGDYCNNEQASNAFAINIGLGDERTKENLKNRYEETKCFDTGIFGTAKLPKVLFELGYADTAMLLYTTKEPISFYSWQKEGATTLREAWQNARSLNHPMFGSVVLYLFENLLGIKQKDTEYKNIVIKPCLTSLINGAKGSVDTASGVISVSFKRDSKKIIFDVVIPAKSDAEFIFEDKKYALAAGANHLEFAQN